MSQVLFAGGRLDSVVINAGTFAEDTTAGSFDSSYADCSIKPGSSTSNVKATFVDATNTPVDVTTGQTVYAHWEAYCTNSTGANNGANWAYLCDSSGQPWLAIRGTSSSVIALFYNSGTGASPVWTQIGSWAFSLVSGQRTIWDMKLTLGSPHSVELSVNGSVVQAGTFTQALLTALRAFYIGNTTNGFSLSQIICTEGKSTIGAKVKYRRATGAGGNSGWTGAYTDVNEAINSDATVNSATSAGLRQTYPMTAVSVPVNYSIATIFHFLRAKNDGAAPANIKSSVRVSSTNYDYAANMPGIGTSFGACLARYDTDPSTSAGWTQSGANAAEFGFLSAT